MQQGNLIKLGLKYLIIYNIRSGRQKLLCSTVAYIISNMFEIMTQNSARMIRFNEMNKTLSPCDLGRTASHFYIRHDSIELYNDGLEKTGHISTMFLFNLVASSKEFAQLKIRNEEMDELDRLAKEAEYNIIGEVYCPVFQLYLK